MPLTEEIRQAAHSLGCTLRKNPAVDAYLELKTRAESDPETAEIESRLAFLSPYVAGSDPDPSADSIYTSAPSEYFALRKKARYHPVLSAREDQLVLVKDVFAQTGSEISAVLGLDYTTLAAGPAKKDGDD